MFSVHKQSKLVRFHFFLSCGDIIDTSLQPFTIFIILTLADIIILCLLKLGITTLIHNKEDIEFVTEFPCLLGHPVYRMCTIHKSCRYLGIFVGLSQVETDKGRIYF